MTSSLKQPGGAAATTGHLFLLSQRQIAAAIKAITETKRITISAKQWEAGANEIAPDNFVFLGVGRKDGTVMLWLTAKAATHAVKGTKGSYVRLSFVRVKSAQSCYTLAEGIGVGQPLKDVLWKKLDSAETTACFFDTTLYAKAMAGLRSAMLRALPKGVGIDTETVLTSVLLNGTAGNNSPVLRDWYDSELLVNEASYRAVLKKRLGELDGQAFETLLAEFFRHGAFGFDTVRTTKRAYDNGIDLVLTRHDDVFGPLLVVGQCKRHIGTISANDVRVLTSVRNTAKAGRAIFITTSHFSRQAEDVAKQDGHVELIDGDRLANLFFRHAEKIPGFWDKIRKSVQLFLTSN